MSPRKAERKSWKGRVRMEQKTVEALKSLSCLVRRQETPFKVSRTRNVFVKTFS